MQEERSERGLKSGGHLRAGGAGRLPGDDLRPRRASPAVRAPVHDPRRIHRSRRPRSRAPRCGWRACRSAGVGRAPAQPAGKVRVDLTVAKRYGDRIRKDSVARIDTQGLLGDKIVEITVGTAQAPVVGAGERLASRDPTDLFQVISGGADTVKNVRAGRDASSDAGGLQQDQDPEDVAAVAACPAGRPTSLPASRPRWRRARAGRMPHLRGAGRPPPDEPVAGHDPGRAGPGRARRGGRRGLDHP